MSADDESAKVPVRSVARAVDLLLALGRGPQQLRTVSAEVGLSKATAYRILTTFRHKEMVLQDPNTGAYRLGPACLHLISSLVDGKAGFPFDAEQDLEDLRTRTGETVTVHVRSGPSRICIEELPSPQVIRYTAGLGVTAGVHVGSAGKVLLAFLEDGEREKVLESLNLQPATPATIIDLQQLREELEKVRIDGVSVSEGERVEGAIGVSAPIFDGRGLLVASLSVLGPETRMGPEQVAGLRTLVREAADRITSRVGA